MQFEYYVLNYNFNKKKVEPFNIFSNTYVQEQTEKVVQEYLENPKQFIYISYFQDEVLYGFEALVKELDRIIKSEEYCRREYEVSIGDAFTTNCEELEKWDTYQQAHMNIEVVTREVVRQYKK